LQSGLYCTMALNKNENIQVLVEKISVDNVQQDRNIEERLQNTLDSEAEEGNSSLEKKEGEDQEENSSMVSYEIGSDENSENEKETMVPPFPKSKVYLTKKGKLNHAARRHFLKFCLKCGVKGHKSRDCQKYKTDCKELCVSCRQGFHQVCHVEEKQTASPDELIKIYETIEQTMFTIAAMLEHVTEKLKLHNEQREELIDKVISVERAVRVRIHTLTKQIEELEKLTRINRWILNLELKDMKYVLLFFFILFVVNGKIFK
jgi:hypothetical protein